MRLIGEGVAEESHCAAARDAGKHTANVNVAAIPCLLVMKAPVA